MCNWIIVVKRAHMHAVEPGNVVFQVRARDVEDARQQVADYLSMEAVPYDGFGRCIRR